MIDGRSRSAHWIIAVLTLAGTLSACRSAGVRPGTGDISFRLTWSGIADLDLYVKNSLGERVDFIFRRVDSGGMLDVDCNVRSDPGSVMKDADAGLCPRPMENIFWPKGDAPPGAYTFWVVVANPEGLEETDEYLVEVRLGKKVVQKHSGTIADLSLSPFVAEYVLKRGLVLRSPKPGPRHDKLSQAQPQVGREDTSQLR